MAGSCGSNWSDARNASRAWSRWPSPANDAPRTFWALACAPSAAMAARPPGWPCPACPGDTQAWRRSSASPRSGAPRQQAARRPARDARRRRCRPAPRPVVRARPDSRVSAAAGRGQSARCRRSRLWTPTTGTTRSSLRRAAGSVASLVSRASRRGRRPRGPADRTSPSSAPASRVHRDRPLEIVVGGAGASDSRSIAPRPRQSAAVAAAAARATAAGRALVPPARAGGRRCPRAPSRRCFGAPRTPGAPGCRSESARRRSTSATPGLRR